MTLHKHAARQLFTQAAPEVEAGMTRSRRGDGAAAASHSRTHDLGGLNGLSLEGTPISSGSLLAFCKQKFFSSAEA